MITVPVQLFFFDYGLDSWCYMWDGSAVICRGSSSYELIVRDAKCQVDQTIIHSYFPGGSRSGVLEIHANMESISKQ